MFREKVGLDSGVSTLDTFNTTSGVLATSRRRGNTCATCVLSGTSTVGLNLRTFLAGLCKLSVECVLFTKPSSIQAKFSSLEGGVHEGRRLRRQSKTPDPVEVVSRTACQGSTSL